MRRQILRHEWRLLTSDGSLWLVVVIFAAAIGYGTLNGVRWVRFQHHAIAEAAREEQERFSAQQKTIARINAGEVKLSPFADPRNPQTAGSRLGARYAVMPPAPLAALSVGQSDLLPYYFKITSDARQNVTAATELENPHRLLSGRVDLAFVLIYLYPLLILAFSYNLLSGDKEQGTLALALSQPVSLATLAVGKLAVRLALFLVTIAGLAGVAMAIAAIPLGADGVAERLMLWLAAVLVYGLVWFALAVLVGSFGRSSATNAMVLAALWLGLVVVLPSVLNMGAATLYPVPSRVALVQAMREASDDATQRGASLLSRYYEDHPELAVGGAEQAMNEFNVVRVAVDAEVEARVKPVLDRYEQQLASQRRFVERLRVLSPAILMLDALNDISGTGTARHQHFLQQVYAFHQQWRAHFVPLIFKKMRLDGYGGLPSFSFTEEPAAESRARIVGSIATMGVLAAVLMALGLQRLQRYPIA
ncbi:MAG: ABC transporter permease [Vicinamibacterales bacterium]